jgi:hypothetical protein
MAKKKGAETATLRLSTKRQTQASWAKSKMPKVKAKKTAKK